MIEDISLDLQNLVVRFLTKVSEDELLLLFLLLLLLDVLLLDELLAVFDELLDELLELDELELLDSVTFLTVN